MQTFAGKPHTAFWSHRRLSSPRARPPTCTLNLQKLRGKAAKAKDTDAGTEELDPAAKFIFARDKLTSSGLRQSQAEALISFVSAAITPLSNKFQSLSGEISTLKKLVYGLYVMAFLVVVLTGKPDSVAGSILRPLASKLVGASG